MLTAEQLVKRLIALIPPRGLHLTNFHGVLAPAAAARPTAPKPESPPTGGGAEGSSLTRRFSARP